MCSPRSGPFKERGTIHSTLTREGAGLLLSLSPWLAQASHVFGNIAFTAYCIHVKRIYRSSVEGVEGGGLAVLRLELSMVYAAAGASLQQCAQNCHDGWEAQKGPEVLFKFQHRLWCRVGS